MVCLDTVGKQLPSVVAMEKMKRFKYQFLALFEMTLAFFFLLIEGFFFHLFIYFVIELILSDNKESESCLSSFELNVDADRIREGLLFEGITACGCSFQLSL